MCAQEIKESITAIINKHKKLTVFIRDVECPTCGAVKGKTCNAGAIAYCSERISLASRIQKQLRTLEKV